MKGIFLIASLLSAPIALADSVWMKLGTNSNGSTFYIDGSHAIKTDKTDAWTKVVLGVPTTIGKDKAEYVVSKIDIDCPTSSFFRVNSIFYNKKGAVLAMDDSESDKRVYAAPDTFDSKLVGIVCNPD